LNELDNKLQTGVFVNTSKDLVLKTVNSIFSFNLRSTLLVNKIIEAYQPFDDFCNTVSNGVCTSCDDVYIVSKEFSERRHFELPYLKPCIRGGQFNRYFCPSDTGDRLLYITKEFHTKNGSNILHYLKEHRQLLVKKSVEKKNGKRAWHILFRARDENLFQIPKLLFRQTGDSIITCLDEEVNYYGINSVNIEILKDSFIEQRKFLLSILNSKLINFIYRNISQEGGRVLSEVKPQRIRTLPIAMPVIEKRRQIEEIVDRILYITKDEDYLQNSNKQAKVKTLEREIDRLVYKLYDLTKEEIKIVESTS